MKIENKKNVSYKPKYKGKIDVAVWENESEKAGKYLTINIGGLKINVFENKPKEE